MQCRRTSDGLVMQGVCRTELKSDIPACIWRVDDAAAFKQAPQNAPKYHIEFWLYMIRSNTLLQSWPESTGQGPLDARGISFFSPKCHAHRCSLCQMQSVCQRNTATTRPGTRSVTWGQLLDTLVMSIATNKWSLNCVLMLLLPAYMNLPSSLSPLLCQSKTSSSWLKHGPLLQAPFDV